MYDKISRLQFSRWTCKNRNDWHPTDHDLTNSIDESESESVIIDESSTEESEPESVHKSINKNKEKYTIDETQDE